MDGYNLPMSVNTNTGCPIAGCFVDLGPNCALPSSAKHPWTLTCMWVGPAQLKGPFDATGFPVGCKTACLANIDGTPGTRYCIVWRPHAYGSKTTARTVARARTTRPRRVQCPPSVRPSVHRPTTTVRDAARAEFYSYFSACRPRGDSPL